MEKRVSLRNKITTAIVMVILFLGITVTFTLNRILPKALEEEAVRAGIEQVDVRHAVNKTLGVVIAVTMLAIVLSIFIGSGLAGLIVKPVNKLRRATDEMADENLEVKLDIKTGDEIQQLATSFNRMAVKLRTSYDELLRSNEELERANRVKSEFLAVMSHELRTPLTAIIGFSELLQEGVMGQLNEDQKDTIREVIHNAADLLSMINCMLDLTKIESGRLCLDVTNFDLAEMLRRVCRTMTPITQKKNVELIVDIPDGMPVMKGDERKVQQTVLNLLSNATKFTPEEGSISLTARHFGSWGEAERKAALERRFDDAERELGEGGVEIVVEDTGIGIPEEHFDRVFDSFYQVDTSTTRTYGGIGLGLSLARQFVEMHGGRIWVESEAGKGARFTIVIPLG
jgi:signal transduction histidine kinase